MLVWENSPAGWSIAVMFGDETLALGVAPTRWAMEAAVDMVWRGWRPSGTAGKRTLPRRAGARRPCQAPSEAGSQCRTCQARAGAARHPPSRAIRARGSVLAAHAIPSSGAVVRHRHVEPSPRRRPH